MLFTVREHPTHLSLGFSDPGSANAFSLSAARELSAMVRSYKKWSLPVVVRAEGARVFCSGGNLSDYKKLRGKAAGLKVNGEITAVLRAFARWPAPKLAAVEGDVFGGGMEWLAYFDFRWSTPASLFAFWQRRIGLTSGWGGGSVWAAKLGGDGDQVRRLLMEARLIGAYEARRLGLIDRVVSAWRLEEEIVAWSTGMAEAVAAGGWAPSSELKIFRSLWMGPRHRAALERWSIGPRKDRPGKP